MSTIEERVQSGMGILDINFPGWEERIDLETLDLEDCELCVLGQQYGNFTEGYLRLGLNWLNVAAESGFNAGDEVPDLDAEYEDLTEEWFTQIRGRLG